MTRQRPLVLIDGVLAVGVLSSAAVYLFVNHRTAHTHDLSLSLDSHIPLLTPFAVPYLLFFPFFWGTYIYALCTGRRFRAFAATAIVVFVVSDLTFVFFQTHVDRPHVEGGGGVFSYMVRTIYEHDEPYNGFPSEHSSSAAMVAIYAFAVRSRWRYFLLAFSALVITSTLFVKQHVIADALGGVTLALITGAVAYHVVRD